MIQQFVVPAWLPAPVTNGSRQVHWSVIRKKAQAAKDMAWASAKNANWKKVEGKAKLTITFTFPVARRRDTDNTYARAKHLVDGLKPWIVDDDTEHLELVVRAVTVPGLKQTEVVLEG